jgi:uncharacterized protein YaaQ
MLLLIAVVQDEDAPFLAKKLMDQGLRLTQLNSSGGIFGSGNVAFLLGIEDDQYDLVMATIQTTCHTRTKHINAAAVPEPFLFSFMPVEVEVGGAVIFVIPIERFIRMVGTAASASFGASSEPIEAMGTQALGLYAEEFTNEAGGTMKLMVAIVQGEDADEVIRALLSAGYRLTRINTMGGFLRRGNATLLIGVEAQQVDEVISLIQTSCRHRAQSTPIEKGLPEYAANVFVLDTSRFIRI